MNRPPSVSWDAHKRLVSMFSHNMVMALDMSPEAAEQPGQELLDAAGAARGDDSVPVDQAFYDRMRAQYFPGRSKS